MWGNLSDASKAAWLMIMQTTMSKEGFDRVMGEQNADGALAAQPSGGGPGGLKFGVQYYWVAVIGTPSATTPWQWQWGGHHVTVNATVPGSEFHRCATGYVRCVWRKGPTDRRYRGGSIRAGELLGCGPEVEGGAGHEVD